MTLSWLLNALDGFNSLHGCMIFLTTNTIDKIDPAVLRKGRTDEIYCVDWLRDEEIKAYARVVFPEYELDPSIEFESMPGCDLYSAFKDNRDDPDAFIDALPKAHVWVKKLMRPVAKVS